MTRTRLAQRGVPLRPQWKSISALATLFPALLAGCTGVLGVSDSDTEGASGSNTMDQEEDGPGASGEVIGPTLRLLTRHQYEQTLAALFPASISLDLSGLEEDVALNGSRAVGASKIALSAKQTEQYLAIAQEAAASAMSDPIEFVGCDPAGETCAEGFIREFGRRAFRRGLSAEEVSGYFEIYQQGFVDFGGSGALEYVITAILMSPHFLYRVELGEEDPDDAERRILFSVEIASKLAYFLWDAPPDPALIAVGEEADLSDPDLIREQALRLMESPRFTDGLRGLFNDYLRLFELSSIQKLPSTFPEFSDSLKSAMQEETLLNLQRGAAPGADFRRVFDSPTTFVNGQLAEFYGVNGATGSDFVEVTLPASGMRVGLLGNASILSLYSHASSTSPTLRGKFVRETLLCQSIPAPPPDVDTTLPEASDSNTTRERFAQHSTDPSCATCHSLMDPIGLGLENFDAVGQIRNEENGFPIDASGNLDGSAFDDPAGLASAVAEHPSLPECVARTVFRYGWGRMENRADRSFIEKLGEGFADGSYQLRELILQAVTDPSFYTTGPLD